MRSLTVLWVIMGYASTASGQADRCEVRVGQTDGMGTLGWPRWYDESGRLLGGEFSVTYSGRGWEVITYDGGRVRSVRAVHADGEGEGCYDGMELRADVDYDAAGRIARIRRHDPHSRPHEQVWRYAYDGEGRLRGIDTDHRWSMTLTWSGERLTRYDRWFPDGLGQAQRYRGVLDWQGDRVVRFVETLPEHPGAWRRELDFVYDAAGRLVEHGAVGGDRHRYEYDARGRLVRDVFLDGGAERPSEYRYDRRGRVVAISTNEGFSRAFRYGRACRAVPDQSPVFEPLAILGLVPCIPTQTGGCLSPDGRRRIHW